MKRLLTATVLLASMAVATYAQESKEESPRARTKEPMKVLLYFGLYTNWYGIDEALKDMGDYELKVSNARTDGADYFPSYEEELSSYDVIILSDVNFPSLKHYGLNVISSFVEDGGSLIVLGGPFTYGKGSYDGTRFLDLLPVELAGKADIKWHKEGLPLSIVDEHKRHVVVKGFHISESPMVFWIHEAKPKPGASVLLNAGERPALVTGRYGKGRIAAFLVTPMGEAPEGKKAFWETEDWKQILQNTLRWLGTRRGKKKIEPAAEAKETLVFSEDFSKGDTKSTGWAIEAKNGCKFIVNENHELEIHHTIVKYSDDKISHAIAPLSKGALEFDLKMGVPNWVGTGGGLNLKVYMGDKMTAFTGTDWTRKGSWLAYGDVIAGSRWTRVGSYTGGKWQRCRMEWDLTTRFRPVRFYVDGELTGVTGFDSDSPVTKISFADYGLFQGDIATIDTIKDIKVYEIK